MSMVDLEFIVGFEHFLKTKDSPCSHNTALKYISQLKKIIRIAINRGWTTHDPFQNYNKSFIKKDPVYLTQNELSEVESKRPEIDRLGLYRELIHSLIVFSQ